MAFLLILLSCNPPLLLKLNINFPGKDNTALSTVLHGEAQGSKTQDEVELKPLNPVVGITGGYRKHGLGKHVLSIVMQGGILWKPQIRRLS